MIGILAFVADYLACLEAKIRLLNKLGLFDEARLFEAFALKMCSLSMTKVRLYRELEANVA